MNQGGKGEWDMRVCAPSERKKREGRTERERERERRVDRKKRQAWSIQKTEVERHTIGVN